MATLRLLGKLTREHVLDADDMLAVLAAGVSRERIEDALAVCLAFNTIDRLASSFEFFIAGPKPSRRARSTYSHAATGDHHLRTSATRHVTHS